MKAIRELYVKANDKFPDHEYLESATVRHNRRAWIRAVLNLRNRPGGSKWILDQPVERKCAN